MAVLQQLYAWEEQERVLNVVKCIHTPVQVFRYKAYFCLTIFMWGLSLEKSFYVGFFCKLKVK